MAIAYEIYEDLLANEPGVPKATEAQERIDGGETPEEAAGNMGYEDIGTLGDPNFSSAAQQLMDDIYEELEERKAYFTSITELAPESIDGGFPFPLWFRESLMKSPYAGLEWDVPWQDTGEEARGEVDTIYIDWDVTEIL